MSKSNKRRKHSPSRRQRAATALAAGASIAAGTHAYGTPVRFDNVARGEPGYFEWSVPIADPNDPGPTLTGMPLDVRLDRAGNLAGAATGVQAQAYYGTSYFRGSIGDIFEVANVGGYPFDSTPAFAAGEEIGYYASFSDEVSFRAGYHTGQDDGPYYIGLRFHDTDGIHYGWIFSDPIRLQGYAGYDGYDGNYLYAQALAWGYETEPGVPIAAGVPEPGTLAMLALGATGLAKFRRRKTRSSN